MSFESSRQDNNTILGHLPSPQSRAQSPCECSKRVSDPSWYAPVALLTVERMLYDFHRLENGKRPGTVHAIYLISGTKRVEEPEVAIASKKDGEDEYMQSSPFMNSSMAQADEGTGASSTLIITLTREEDLDRTTFPSFTSTLLMEAEIRSQYEQITSIHIYSLGPHPLRASSSLSDLRGRAN